MLKKDEELRYARGKMVIVYAGALYRQLVIRAFVLVILLIVMTFSLFPITTYAPLVYKPEHYDELIRKLELAHKEIVLQRFIIDSYASANEFKVTATAYTARPEETNENPEMTAIMSSPRPGKTIAVSRDLRGWLGKRVYVEGYGVRKVNDLMNKRYDNRRIDILMPDVQSAREFGVQELSVFLLEPFETASEEMINYKKIFQNVDQDGDQVSGLQIKE